MAGKLELSFVLPSILAIVAVGVYTDYQTTFYMAWLAICIRAYMFCVCHGQL